MTVNPTAVLDEIASNINERGPLKQAIINAIEQLDSRFEGDTPKEAKARVSAMRTELYCNES
jgi:hypothetical protein